MKYNIGDTVYLKGKVTSAHIMKGRTEYTVSFGGSNCTLFREETLDRLDCVPLDDYEREINDLKEDVRQWQDMYQGEHLKVEKLKDQLESMMPSHKPQENTYQPRGNTCNCNFRPMHKFDDWRLP